MLAAVLQASSTTQSSNTVFEVVAKNTVYGQWRCARKPSFGTGCICCLLPTFGWRLACGQCLLLSALSGPWWVAQLKAGLSPMCKFSAMRRMSASVKLRYPELVSPLNHSPVSKIDARM